jgi:riboflavin synthase
MFTGIVQGTALVQRLNDLSGLRRLELRFDAGFTEGLNIGASVSVDGACLTVTQVAGDQSAGGELASFDVIQETLSRTTLGALREGSRVNVERAAKEGAEIGGHAVSGHIDCKATVLEIRTPENNRIVRFGLEKPWSRYVFAKGYIAVDGASLTVSAVDRGAGWFEVSLIPETLRVTGLGQKQVGSEANIEIERGTQIVVDTVREALEEKFQALLPALEQVLLERGVRLDELAVPEALRRLGRG